MGFHVIWHHWSIGVIMDKKRKISKNQSTNLICCGNQHSSYDSQSEVKIALWTLYPTVILTESTAFLISLWLWPTSYFIISNMVDWDWYSWFLSTLLCWFCAGLFGGLPSNGVWLWLPYKYQGTCNTRHNSANGFLLLVGRANCLWCLLYLL